MKASVRVETRRDTERAAFEAKKLAKEATNTPDAAPSKAKPPTKPAPVPDESESDAESSDARSRDEYSSSSDEPPPTNDTSESDSSDSEEQELKNPSPKGFKNGKRPLPATKKAEKPRKKIPRGDYAPNVTFTFEQIKDVLQSGQAKSPRRPKSVMVAFNEGKEQLDEFLKHFTNHIQTYDLKANNPAHMEEIYSNFRPLIKKSETTHLLEEALTKTKNEGGNWDRFVLNFLDKAYPPNYHKHIRETISIITRRRDEICSAFLIRIISESGKIPATNAIHMREVDIKDLFISRVMDSDLIRHLILKDATSPLKTLEDITSMIRMYEKANSFVKVTKNQGHTEDAPGPRREAPQDVSRDRRDSRRDTPRDTQFRATEDREARQSSPSPRNDTQHHSPRGETHHRRERDDSKQGGARGGKYVRKCSFCQEDMADKREHHKICKFASSKEMQCGFCNETVLKNDAKHMVDCPKVFCRPCERKGVNCNHSWHKCVNTKCRLCNEMGHSNFHCPGDKATRDRDGGSTGTERANQLSRVVRTQSRGGAPFCNECEQNYSGDMDAHNEVCQSFQEYLNYGDYDSQSDEEEVVSYSHAKDVGCGNCLTRTFEDLETIRKTQKLNHDMRVVLEKADAQLDNDASQLSYTDSRHGWKVYPLKPRILVHVSNNQTVCTTFCYLDENEVPTTAMSTAVLDCFFYSPRCPVFLRDTASDACFNPKAERYNLHSITLQIAKLYHWPELERDVADKLKDYDDNNQVYDPSPYCSNSWQYMSGWLKFIRTSFRRDLPLIHVERDNSRGTAAEAYDYLKAEAVNTTTNLSPNFTQFCQIMGRREYLIERWRVKIEKLMARVLESVPRGTYKENVKFFLFMALSYLQYVPSAFIAYYIDSLDHANFHSGYNYPQLYVDKTICLFLEALLHDKRCLMTKVPAEPYETDLDRVQERIDSLTRVLRRSQPQTYARREGRTHDYRVFIFNNEIEGSSNNMLQAFFIGIWDNASTITLAKNILASRLWVYDRALPNHYVLIELYMLAFYNTKPIDYETQTCYCPGCRLEGTFSEIKLHLAAFTYEYSCYPHTQGHILVDTADFSIRELMVPFFNNALLLHSNAEGRTNLRYRSNVVVPTYQQLETGEYMGEPGRVPSEADDSFAIWCIWQARKFPIRRTYFNGPRPDDYPHADPISELPDVNDRTPRSSPPGSPIPSPPPSPVYLSRVTPLANPLVGPLVHSSVRIDLTDSPISNASLSPVRRTEYVQNSPLRDIEPTYSPISDAPLSPVRKPDEVMPFLDLNAMTQTQSAIVAPQLEAPHPEQRVTRASAKRAREASQTRSHDSKPGMVKDDEKQPPKPPTNAPPRSFPSLEKISDCFELAAHLSLKVTLVAKKELVMGTSFPYVGKFIDLVEKNFALEVQAFGPVVGGFCVPADPTMQAPGYIEQTTSLDPVVEVTVRDEDTDLICSVGLGGEGLFAYMDRSQSYEDCNAIVVYVHEHYPRIQLTRTLLKGELVRLFQHNQIAGVPNTSGTTCWFSVFLHMYGDLNLHNLLRDSKSVAVRLLSKFVREMETFKYRDENATIANLESLFMLLGQFIKGGIKTTFDLAEFWDIFFGTILQKEDIAKVRPHLTSVQTSVLCIHCDTVKVYNEPKITLPMCHLNTNEESVDFNNLMRTLPGLSRLHSERYCSKCKKITKDNERLTYSFGDVAVISIPRKIETKNLKTGESHIKKLHNQVFVEPLTEFNKQSSNHQYQLSGVVLHQRHAHFQTDKISSSYTTIDGGHYTYARYAQLTSGKEMNLFNDACVTTKSATEILVNCARKVVFVVLQKLTPLTVNESPTAMIVSPVEEKKSSSGLLPPFTLNKAVSKHEEKNERLEMDFSKLKYNQTPSKDSFPIVAQLQVTAERKEAEDLLNSVLEQCLNPQTPSPSLEVNRND